MKTFPEENFTFYLDQKTNAITENKKNISIFNTET